MEMHYPHIENTHFACGWDTSGNREKGHMSGRAKKGIRTRGDSVTRSPCTNAQSDVGPTLSADESMRFCYQIADIDVALRSN